MSGQNRQKWHRMQRDCGLSTCFLRLVELLFCPDREHPALDARDEPGVARVSRRAAAAGRAEGQLELALDPLELVLQARVLTLQPLNESVGFDLVVTGASGRRVVDVGVAAVLRQPAQRAGDGAA